MIGNAAINFNLVLPFDCWTELITNDNGSMLTYDFYTFYYRPRGYCIPVSGVTVQVPPSGGLLVVKQYSAMESSHT